MNESNTTYRGYNAGHLFLALLAGAAAGAGVAYLTAPQSGRATRSRLRTVAHQTNEAAHRVPNAVRNATEVARDAFVNSLDLDGLGGLDNCEGDGDAEVVVTKPKRASSRHTPAQA